MVYPIYGQNLFFLNKQYKTAAYNLTATLLQLDEILMTLMWKLCVFVCSCTVICPLEMLSMCHYSQR